MPYTAIVNVTKLGLDVVTMKSDLHHLKVGCIDNICISKVVCSFALSSLLELQRRSGVWDKIMQEVAELISSC